MSSPKVNVFKKKVNVFLKDLHQLLLYIQYIQHRSSIPAIEGNHQVQNNQK